jgi:hypothetical protein
MNKRNLFGEIRQGIEALSCARKAENSSPTEKLKPEAILSAPVIVPKKGHSIGKTKWQGMRAELSKGYKAMSQDSDREREAFDWSEAVVGDAKG